MLDFIFTVLFYFTLSFVLFLIINNIPFHIRRDFSKRSANNDEEGGDKENPFPIYPNGWIPVMGSNQLKTDKIKSVQFCGQTVVICRGFDGKVYVLDAYCPHLGANFAFGGSVVKEYNEDCIKCPFHGWLFGVQDGLCKHIPYAENNCVPSGIKVNTWSCIEVNDFIYIWHHTEGIEPNWFPPKLEEVGNSGYVNGAELTHTVNCHIQEIPENGADWYHLHQIHSHSLLHGNKVQIKEEKSIRNIMKHNWKANWIPCSQPNKHMAEINLTNQSMVFNHELFRSDFQIEQIGPAIVHFQFKLKFLNLYKGIFIQNLIPIGPKKTKIIHNIYIEKGFLSSLVAKFMAISLLLMVERDIKIWNKKKLLRNPKLIKEDKQIKIFRKWYSQFYSQNDLSW